MDCNSSASCLTHALTICEGLKQNAYEDLIEPIQLGLKWIYANQPDPSAALSPAGIVFHGDLPQNIGEIESVTPVIRLVEAV